VVAVSARVNSDVGHLRFHLNFEVNLGMKKICFATIILAMFAITVFAQDTSKPPTAKYGGMKGATRMIELSNMAGDVSECAKATQPYTGTIVRRVFDDDELTLIGIGHTRCKGRAHLPKH
jgi:hypothetical protein